MKFENDGLTAIQIIAENRIREAIEAGEFEGLPGKGKPLSRCGRNPYVDPTLQLALDILSNANCVPPVIDGKKLIDLLLEDLEAAERRLEERHARRLKSFNEKMEELLQRTPAPPEVELLWLFEKIPTPHWLEAHFTPPPPHKLSHMTWSALRSPLEICSQWERELPTAMKSLEEKASRIRNHQTTLNRLAVSTYDAPSSLQTEILVPARLIASLNARYLWTKS